MDAPAGKLVATRNGRIKDLMLSGLLIGLGIFAYLQIAGTTGTGFVTGQTMTHATLPTIWAVLMALLAALWGIQSYLELRDINRKLGVLARDGGTEARPVTKQPFFNVSSGLIVRMAIMVASLLVYCSVIEIIPFALATGVFLLVMLLTFGRPLGLQTLLLAAIGGGAFHLLFVTFLKLPLY